MGLFASASWIRSVRIIFEDCHQAITSFSVLHILRQRSSFLRRVAFLQQLINRKLSYQSFRIVVLEDSTPHKASFAGVGIEGNCNQFNFSDIVAKKNTQIDRLSVLRGAVCYNRKRTVVRSRLAHCPNKINFFGRCYV